MVDWCRWQSKEFLEELVAVLMLVAAVVVDVGFRAGEGSGRSEVCGRRVKCGLDVARDCRFREDKYCCSKGDGRFTRCVCFCSFLAGGGGGGGAAAAREAVSMFGLEQREREEVRCGAVRCSQCRFSCEGRKSRARGSRAKILGVQGQQVKWYRQACPPVLCEWSGCDRHKQAPEHSILQEIIYPPEFNNSSPPHPRTHSRTHYARPNGYIPPPPSASPSRSGARGGSPASRKHGSCHDGPKEQPVAGTPNIAQMIDLPTKPPPQA